LHSSPNIVAITGIVITQQEVVPQARPEGIVTSPTNAASFPSALLNAGS